jgi:hypothetical protein
MKSMKGMEELEECRHCDGKGFCSLDISHACRSCSQVLRVQADRIFVLCAVPCSFCEGHGVICSCINSCITGVALPDGDELSTCETHFQAK